MILVTNRDVVLLFSEIAHSNIEESSKHVRPGLRFHLSGGGISARDDVPIRDEIVLVALLPNEASCAVHRSAVGKLLNWDSRQ